MTEVLLTPFVNMAYLIQVIFWKFTVLLFQEISHRLPTQSQLNSDLIIDVFD